GSIFDGRYVAAVREPGAFGSEPKPSVRARSVSDGDCVPGAYACGAERKIKQRCNPCFHRPKRDETGSPSQSVLSILKRDIDYEPLGPNRARYLRHRTTRRSRHPPYASKRL